VPALSWILGKWKTVFNAANNRESNAHHHDDCGEQPFPIVVGQLAVGNGKPRRALQEYLYMENTSVLLPLEMEINETFVCPGIFMICNCTASVAVRKTELYDFAQKTITRWIEIAKFRTWTCRDLVFGYRNLVFCTL
jgi:hypothetical protein